MSEVDGATKDLKSVSAGVDWLGKAIAGVALAKFVLHTFSMPATQWIGILLAAHSKLFYPIIDYSVGLIPRIFGMSFSDNGRDAILIYSLFGASAYRVLHRTMADFKWRTPFCLAVATVWPVTTIAIFGQVAILYFLLPSDEMEGAEIMDYLIVSYFKDLITVIAIAATATVLNAAGLL